MKFKIPNAYSREECLVHNLPLLVQVDHLYIMPEEMRILLDDASRNDTTYKDFAYIANWVKQHAPEMMTSWLAMHTNSLVGNIDALTQILLYRQRDTASSSVFDDKTTSGWVQLFSGMQDTWFSLLPIQEQVNIVSLVYPYLKKDYIKVEHLKDSLVLCWHVWDVGKDIRRLDGTSDNNDQSCSMNPIVVVDQPKLVFKALIGNRDAKKFREEHYPAIFDHARTFSWFGECVEECLSQHLAQTTITTTAAHTKRHLIYYLCARHFDEWKEKECLRESMVWTWTTDNTLQAIETVIGIQPACGELWYEAAIAAAKHHLSKPAKEWAFSGKGMRYIAQCMNKQQQ